MTAKTINNDISYKTIYLTITSYKQVLKPLYNNKGNPVYLNSKFAYQKGFKDPVSLNNNKLLFYIWPSMMS